MLITRLLENAKLTNVLEIIISAPLEVRIVPAIKTADGFKILISWSATITIGKKNTGSAFEFLRSEIVSGLVIRSTYLNALKISVHIPEVLFFLSLSPARDIVVGFSFEYGPS